MRRCVNLIKLYIIAVSILVFCAGCSDKGVGIVTSNDKPQEKTVFGTDTEALDEGEIAYNESNGTEAVAVYVCGFVNNPGVYYLDSNAIKQDALEAAGGFSEKADQSFINLAERISEGEKIYFPSCEEIETGEVTESELIKQVDADTGKVNVNTATKEELMQLPGIGESKAQAIIDYRENNGRFGCVEDIKNISGIKEGIYDKISSMIVVN